MVSVMAVMRVMSRVVMMNRVGAMVCIVVMAVPMMMAAMMVWTVMMGAPRIVQVMAVVMTMRPVAVNLVQAKTMESGVIVCAVQAELPVMRRRPDLCPERFPSPGRGFHMARAALDGFVPRPSVVMPKVIVAMIARTMVVWRVPRKVMGIAMIPGPYHYCVPRG